MTISSGAAAGVTIAVIVVVAIIIVVIIMYTTKDDDSTSTCGPAMYKTDLSKKCLNCDDTCRKRSETSTALSCVPNRYPVCSAWTLENAFECAEGEWVLMETSSGGVDSLVGTYYILRDPSADNVGKYDVVNMGGPGSGAYLLGDANITLANAAKSGKGTFVYTITGAKAATGTKQSTAITIPNYFKAGSIPTSCLPPIYGTDDWLTNRTNGLFTFFTFSDSAIHTLSLAKSGNFGSNCICEENQYPAGCSLFADATCKNCMGCGLGHYMTTPCYMDETGVVQPTVCTECKFGLQPKVNPADADKYICTYMDEDPNFATACKKCDSECLYMHPADHGCDPANNPDGITCTAKQPSECINTVTNLVCMSGYYYLYNANGVVQSGPYYIIPHPSIFGRWNFNLLSVPNTSNNTYYIDHTTLSTDSKFRVFVMHLNETEVVNVQGNPFITWIGDACNSEEFTNFDETSCYGCQQRIGTLTSVIAETDVVEGMFLVAQRSACAVGTYNLYNSADVYMSGPYVISMNLSIDSLFQFNVLYQGILDDANSQVLLSSSGNVTSQIKIENNDTYMGVFWFICRLFTVHKLCPDTGI